jgi:hypothetical protein
MTRKTRTLINVTALVLLFILGGVLATVRESQAIPAWARKYNADCSMCHFPVIPRLNSYGHQFRRAGYRTPEDFNKDQDVTKVGDFLSARLRGRFNYDNTEGRIERSEFRLNDATFFYAGAISRNFSAFVESEIESDGEIALVGQLQGVFGRADRYVSVRGGQMHTLQRVGFGGFDRPSGISTNPVHSTALTRVATINGANFALNNDQKGIEVAYVQGRGRLLGQILNGMNTSGSGTATVGDTDPDKDFLVAYEHILDDIASGFTMFYYKGTYHQVATATALSDRFDFSRLGVNANKVLPVPFGYVELQGGYVRSHDNVPSTVGPDVQGNAFYVESQQVLAAHDLTFLERYSLIDQDAARRNSIRQVYTGGIVMPVQTWFRLAAEYTYTDNRATGSSDHSAIVELQGNW